MSDSLQLISLESLLNETPEEVDWLIEGLLPMGACSTWVAKPKVGKTTIIENAIFSVSTGTQFLRRTCKQGSVLYLQLEASRNETASHFRKMGATGQAPITVHLGPIVASDRALAVEVAIRKLSPVMVVVDSVQRLMKFKDINDYAEVSRQFEPYMHMAHEYNVHFCFLHHMGKEERASSSDAILGSTAIFASVDLALIMLKKHDVRTIQTDGSQRFGVNIPETILHYDPETCYISVGEAFSEVVRDDLRQAILDALGDMKLRMEEIKKAVGGDTSKVHGEVQRLHMNGFLEREGKGKPGDPYRFFVRQPPDDIRPNDIDQLLDPEEIRHAAEEYLREQDENPLFKGIPR